MVVTCFVCLTRYHVHEFLQIANSDFLLEDKCSILRTPSYGLFPLLSTVIDPVILFLFSTNQLPLCVTYYVDELPFTSV